MHSLSNSANDLFWGTTGPVDAAIVLVAESWGEEEASQHLPLVGSSGTELNRMLAAAGFDRNSILCTNVVSERPPRNEMWRFFHAKRAPSGLPHIGGLDPRANVRASLERLYRQIAAHPRRCVIAAGSYALWALAPECINIETISESNKRKIPTEDQVLGPTGIGSWRGSMWYARPDQSVSGADRLLVSELRLLPIYHPAGIMRQWAWREPTVHDLRTRLPLALAGDWRPNPAPKFLAPPTFEDTCQTLHHWLSLATKGTPVELAEDIETARGLITCLGLADSASFAISIPFIRKRHDNSFDSWWTIDEESEIVRLLRRINRHPAIHVIGQNFIYDTQYIQHWCGITPRLFFDTMLAQNVLYPGTPKTLEYLSSLYCKYHWYWKEDHKEWDAKGSIEDLLRYNCVDCIRTWEIAQVQKGLIEGRGLAEPWRIKMQTNDLCLRMMNRGVRIDTNRQMMLQLELNQVLGQLAEELLFIIPQSVVDPDYEENFRKRKEKYVHWYRSDKQSKWVMNEMLGLPVVSNRKTGNPTSGKEARNIWLEKHPEWTGLLRRIAAYESADNTLHVVKSPLDPDKRMRCSFGPGGTESHRLNSSHNAFGRGTNLQNLTEGNEEDA